MPSEIQPHELATLLESGQAVYLLDVRRPWEHAHAAIAGSTLVPLHELEARWSEIRLPASGIMVTYCHHGVRSWHAAAYLESRGLGPVYSLSGGIDAWSRLVDPAIPRY